jgi:hypothetical protein
MEHWNNGFRETGAVVYWKKYISKGEIIIPIFPGPDLTCRAWILQTSVPKTIAINGFPE